MIALAVTFTGTCERCAWVGPERVSNLSALADFDRHHATYDHRHRELVAAAAEAQELFGDDELEAWALAHPVGGAA